jgi:hypothetical protein
MAARRSFLVDRDPPPQPPQEPAADELEPTPEQLEREAKRAEFMASFVGKGYSVRVERWKADGAEWVFLQTMKYDGFELEHLRKFVLGPEAKFRLTLLDDKKHYVAGGRFEQSVANPEWKDPATVPAAPAAAAAPVDPLSSPLVAVLLKQNEQTSAQLMAVLQAIASKPTPTTQDPLDLILKFKQLFPQEKGVGLKEQLELMAMIDKLRGPDRDPGEGSWLKDAKEALELVMAARKQLPPPSAPRAAAAPGQPQPAAAPRVVQNPPNIKETEPVSNPILDTIRSYVPILVRKAENQEDPKDVAEFVAAELETTIVKVVIANYKPGGITLDQQTIIDQVIGAAKDPLRVEQVYGFAPELAPYREWVALVVAATVAELEAPDEDATAHA